MASIASIEPLCLQLQRCTTASAYADFSTKREALERDFDLPSLCALFSGSVRLVGRSALPEPCSVPGSDGAVPLTDFTADVVARALLLLAVARGHPAQLKDTVWGVYRQGDTLEQLAVVRSLALLPGPERFVELALDAGRTNDIRLFRALACDNPFPAQHYPELEWNKLLMKAAFVDVPIEHVLGRAARSNSELSRMALEYIEQQESAGRAFPPAILHEVAAYPRPSAVAKLLGYASHAVAELRLAAVQGLLRARQPRTVSFLTDLLEVETDERVRDALVASLRTITDPRSSP